MDLLCVSFIFADSEICQFGGMCDGFLCLTEIIRIFLVATLIIEVLFDQFYICAAV